MPKQDRAEEVWRRVPRRALLIRVIPFEGDHPDKQRKFWSTFHKSWWGQGAKPLVLSTESEMLNGLKSTGKGEFSSCRDEKRENPCEGFSLGEDTRQKLISVCEGNTRLQILL